MARALALLMFLGCLGGLAFVYVLTHVFVRQIAETARARRQSEAG